MIPAESRRSRGFAAFPGSHACLIECSDGVDTHLDAISFLLKLITWGVAW
jgi:hypothetical protein